MTRQPTPINILDDLMPLGNGAAAIRQALLWDYEQLGADADAVRQHAVEIKLSERRASDAIVDAGRHLIAVRDRLQHGQWQDWLSVEFKMSDRTARRMMAVAEQFDGKTDTVSVLGPSVLYLLAGDSVPEPAREAVIELAKTGQTVTKAQAQTIIDQHKPTKPAAAPRRYESGLPALNMPAPTAPAPAITSVDIQLPAQYAALYARCQSFSDGRYAVWYNNAQGLYNADQFSDYDSMIRWLDARQAPAPAIVAADARPLPQWVTAEPEPEPLTAADLTVMQPAPELAASEEYLAYSARAQQNGDAYLNYRDWCTWVKADRPVVTAALIERAPAATHEAVTRSQAAVAAYDDRVGKMVRLIGIYKSTIGTFDEYGDLCGAYLEPLAAKRELEKLIRHLERECALLEGRPVADGWMVEEAA